MRARFLGIDPESHVENSPTLFATDRTSDVHRPGVKGDRSPSIGMLAYELTETVTGHALACLYAAPPRTGSGPAAIVAAGMVGPPLTVLEVLPVRALPARGVDAARRREWYPDIQNGRRADHKTPPRGADGAPSHQGQETLPGILSDGTFVQQWANHRDSLISR
jgi:hypothetical protein